jgi:hypothetical protein
LNTEFDKLSTDKQVEFINNELTKDNDISVTRLCKKFGFNKSTIISRFTKDGYKYNVNTREYIKNDAVIHNNNKSINKEIIQNDNRSISTNNIEVASEQQDLEQSKELKDRLKDIKELLELKDKLKEVIQHYNKSKNIIDVPEAHELRVDLSKFNGELKGRLIKVYDNVNDSWIEFCKKNSQFKMQDLYSIALLEFMEKYSKK